MVCVNTSKNGVKLVGDILSDCPDAQILTSVVQLFGERRSSRPDVSAKG